MDFLKLMDDYVLSTMSTQNWLITGLGILLVCGFAYISYLKSGRHVEREVSKRKMQTRHREVLDVATSGILDGLLNQTQKGKLTQEEFSYVCNYIQKNCPKFKELVLDTDGTPKPSFGRPWYYGPNAIPKAKAVKDAIWNRLRESGKTTKELWDHRKRLQAIRASGTKTAQEDQAALLAALKQHTK